MEPAELDTTAEKFDRAREALQEYAATDPEVPVGGHQVRDYERWRHETEDVSVLSPQQQLERGWLELEYAMAIMRGAIDPETEEPFDERKINTAFEAARQFFGRLAKDESVPLPLRMQARIASLSVNQHEEIVKGKPMVKTSRYYAQFLNGLRSAAQMMLREVEHTPELGQLIHMIEIMALMTEAGYSRAWFMPAASRQPWDLTVHAVQRVAPDINVVINRPAVNEHDFVISTENLAGFVNPKDPFALMRRYLELDVEFTAPTGHLSLPAHKLAAWQVQNDKKQSLFAVINHLTPSILAHMERMYILGIRPAEEIIVETAHPEEPPRDLHPEVVWYLTEYNPDLPHDGLAAQVAALEKRRSAEGLWPDEQRTLGWMQLELAIAMSLDAEERPELDAAREYFSVAMDTFIRAQRAFLRTHRPGDAHDALLAQAGTDVYRAFYTSRNKDGSVDNYAVRRATNRYIEQVSEAFASANKVKSSPEDVIVLADMVSRATLIMLQAVANEELRHLILPAPLRTSHDVTALHLIHNEKVSGYDIIAPVSIIFVEGDEVTVGDHHVQVGRDALNVAGSPDVLLKELLALLGKESSKGGKPKGKTKGAKPKPLGSAAIARSAEVSSLSEKLAYAISDAYEYEPE